MSHNAKHCTVLLNNTSAGLGCRFVILKLLYFSVSLGDYEPLLYFVGHCLNLFPLKQIKATFGRGQLKLGILAKTVSNHFSSELSLPFIGIKISSWLLWSSYRGWNVLVKKHQKWQRTALGTFNNKNRILHPKFK